MGTSNNGVSIASGLNNVVEDTAPQLGGDLDLNTKNISSLGALGSDHTYEGTIVNRAVGENVLFGQPLYYNWTDKEYKLALANAAATMPVVGIALESKANGQICKILVKGWIRDDDYDFSGSIVYAFDNSNGFVTAAPGDSGDQVQVCGMAYSADVMFFDPNSTIVEIA